MLLGISQRVFAMNVTRDFVGCDEKVRLGKGPSNRNVLRGRGLAYVTRGGRSARRSYGEIARRVNNKTADRHPPRK